MISSMASITSSSSSAAVRVDKATSEFLIGPDWTMNIDICDTINSNQMLAKDVVKAVKKRLQHKKPKVQLLALTLLETMVQNCGDYVHFQIAERNILPEMVRIVKKKTDMHVRDKILSLTASWNAAFGGSSGRYPQYYMAYEDLRRYGVAFPQISPSSVPITTNRPIAAATPPLPGYGVPSSSSSRLDQVMAADDSLSLSSISSMREVIDLLADMLLAVDPRDPSAVKDEVIVDLVEQCRANQKKLMKTLTSTTGDEELLAQGLEVNDKIQTVLAKHDAIASGSPLPVDVIINTNREALISPEITVNQEISSPKSAEIGAAVASARDEKAPAKDVAAHKSTIIDEDEEEEDDDFALLARRHSKTNGSGTEPSGKPPSSPGSSHALVPVSDYTSTTQTTKDQDIIDLLSLTLSTEQAPPQTHTVSEDRVPANDNGPSFSSNGYPQNQHLGFNGYVAPWARAQQPQIQAPASHQPEAHTYPNLQSQQFQSQEVKSQHVPQEVNHYPPPPWAPTPNYYSSQSYVTRQPYTFSNPRPTMPSSSSSNNNGDANVINNNSFGSPRSPATSGGNKPFVPSYRLFEDLDVFGTGNNEARPKAGNNQSLSASASNSQSIAWGRK